MYNKLTNYTWQSNTNYNIETSFVTYRWFATKWNALLYLRTNYARRELPLKVISWVLIAKMVIGMSKMIIVTFFTLRQRMALKRVLCSGLDWRPNYETPQVPNRYSQYHEECYWWLWLLFPYQLTFNWYLPPGRSVCFAWRCALALDPARSKKVHWLFWSLCNTNLIFQDEHKVDSLCPGLTPVSSWRSASVIP